MGESNFGAIGAGGELQAGDRFWRHHEFFGWLLSFAEIASAIVVRAGIAIFEIRIGG